MQVPSILQGESRTRLLQGIAIGAVASMVIGFSFGGWVTGATANKLAAERARSAVVKVLTPICVEKFMQNGDAQANLAALRNITSELATRRLLGERRLGDTAWGYLSRLRAWEGVCGEIDRSQSGIPMSSIGPMQLVHFGKMALADDIDLHVSRLSFSRVILKVL